MAETSAPPRPAEVGERGPGYDEDFFLWSQRQAALIRAGHLELVDLENVAEEIESLGRRDRRELCSRLEVLVVHLLKWQFQPMHRSRSWRSTIRTQRHQIERMLKESPSLRREAPALSRDTYDAARNAAATETGFAVETFPQTLPYSAVEILGEDFFPGQIDEA